MRRRDFLNYLTLSALAAGAPAFAGMGMQMPINTTPRKADPGFQPDVDLELTAQPGQTQLLPTGRPTTT